MYSHCPHCRTLFRIYPEQLSQARGQVRCGVCNYSFNALETLSEHPVWPPEPTLPEGEAATLADAGEHHTPAISIPEEVYLETEAVDEDSEQGAAFESEREDVPQHGPYISMPAEARFETEGMDEDTQQLEAMEAEDEEPPLHTPLISAPAEGHLETKEFEADTEQGIAMEAEAEDAVADSEQATAMEAAAEEAPQHAPLITSATEAQLDSEEIDALSEQVTETRVEAEELPTAATSEVAAEASEPIAVDAERETAEVPIETATSTDEAPPTPEQAFEAQAISGTPTTPSVSEEKTATPLSAQVKSALPDLGIIAAEPRPMTAPQQAASGFKTGLWAMVNIVLILILLGQYAYFNRGTLSQYPELRPWLASLCAALGCETPLQRDVNRIVLTNRIVESHPKYPNALLIDATLVNDTDFPQPYPLVEIRFSDLNNQLVAGRRFRPGEYLPAGTRLQTGMAPRQPVHIILEIVDPGKDAVSFQFELL